MDKNSNYRAVKHNLNRRNKNAKSKVAQRVIGTATLATLLSPTIVQIAPHAIHTIQVLAATTSDQSTNSVELDPQPLHQNLLDEAKFATDNGVKVTKNPTIQKLAPSTPQSASIVKSLNDELITNYTNSLNDFTSKTNKIIELHNIEKQLEDYQNQAIAKGFPMAKAINSNVMQSVDDSTLPNIQTNIDKANTALKQWQDFINNVSSGNTTSAGTMVLQNVNTLLEYSKYQDDAYDLKAAAEAAQFSYSGALKQLNASKKWMNLEREKLLKAGHGYGY